MRNAQNDEVEEELRGRADLDALGAGGVRASRCPRRAASICRPARFSPTTHLGLILKHAREGDKSVSYKVFDGARLDGAFQVNAVIGRPPRAAGPVPAVKGDVALLRGQPEWGVRFAFFANGDQGAQPEYELALGLLGNGVARSMLLDYGDFAVDARLIQIEALPRPKMLKQSLLAAVLAASIVTAGAGARTAAAPRGLRRQRARPRPARRPCRDLCLRAQGDLRQLRHHPAHAPVAGRRPYPGGDGNRSRR